MKCPKCDYLGFETGDRCKNCGYNFSLIDSSTHEDPDVDLPLRLAADETPAAPGPDIAIRNAQATAASAQRAFETPLPLFAPTDDASDEPLIKLPATPRPPLAVRRAAETPRLRAVLRPPSRVAPEPEPALEFADEPVATAAPVVRARAGREMPGAESGTSTRLASAGLDHAILLAIDLVVVYFTLRMAGLSNSDWLALPFAPLLAFLLLLKLSYFSAFTAVGGQTIGKMAMGIRVVTDAGAPVDGACALRRTMAGALSTAALGLGFIPALVGSNNRALHDRMAHTRVVDLRPS